MAAAVIAAVALAASQGHAFMQQYVTQLGQRVAAAQTHLDDVHNGLRYRIMAEKVRAELERETQTRFNELSKSQDAVAGANILIRPLALARHYDSETLTATQRAFVPSLPSGVGGSFYVFFGMIAGFLLYEFLKFPVMVLVREPRRRKFRRR